MRKVLLGVLGLALIATFSYMVSASLRGEGALWRWPPPLLPHAPTVGNSSAMIEALPYTRVLLNTAILAGCVMVGQVLTSAAAGYAFARLRFPGRAGIITTSLAILSLPATLLLIPRYLMIQALGWADTYPGLISTELVSVWGIFFMRQAFLMLPREVEDAARVDGAGEWTLFWRVGLPLVRTAGGSFAGVGVSCLRRHFLWPVVRRRWPRGGGPRVGFAQVYTPHAGNWPSQ